MVKKYLREKNCEDANTSVPVIISPEQELVHRKPSKLRISFSETKKVVSDLDDGNTFASPTFTQSFVMITWMK